MLTHYKFEGRITVRVLRVMYRVTGVGLGLLSLGLGLWVRVMGFGLRVKHRINVRVRS